MRSKRRPQVDCAMEADVPAWLALAREVEPLFGPMVEEAAFHTALGRAIAEGRAFCTREAGGSPGAPLWGGILISHTHNEVTWLTVAAAHRGQGWGRALLAHALDRLDRTRPVVVQTFDATVEVGRAARRLYTDFGFRDHHPAEPTPAGIPTTIMVRPAALPHEADPSH